MLQPRARTRNPELAELETRAGLVFHGANDYLPRLALAKPDGRGSSWGAIDADIFANDAEPTLVTTPNAGVLNRFTQYVDPKLIEVLLTPNNASKIYGETKKGNWVTETAAFPMVESTGEVASYDDYSTNGRAGANVQWVNRQSYLFQTFTEWGEREIERMGAANIDWMARLNISSGVTLNKFMNQSWFYGVSNLALYGALNDPSLSAALTPATKAAGGTSWKNATPVEIVADIQALWAQLQVQTGSNLEMDTPMTLALHAVSETYLWTPNQFGLTAIGLLKTTFPGLRFQQAPQFLSGTVYSCQLIVDEIDGQETVDCGFTEKMRAHAVIQAPSSFRQKKSAGTWGALIFMPIGIASMTAI